MQASDASPGSAGIDLSQFHQIFFEEAGENLETMEQMLLGIDLAAADDETLNAVFRCAHSVKGGAATFGFADVTELTHQMETLLDKLRRHELSPSAGMVDVLLASGDALKAQLARHQAGGGGDAIETTTLVAAIRSFVESPAASSAATRDSPQVASRDAASHGVADTHPPAPHVASTAKANTATGAAAAAPKGGDRALELTLGPLPDPRQADRLQELFKDVVGLGTIEPLDAGCDADGLRRFKVLTTSSDDDLLDLFEFHVSRQHVRIAPLGPDDGSHEGAPGAPPTDADAAYGFFEDAPGAPRASTDAAAPPAAARAGGRAGPQPKAQTVPETTLRVSVDKVDQLINLVGELVITHSMLAQNRKVLPPEVDAQFTAGLSDLERNTRSLQEAVMSIRMIPMSQVFNRFPRMLRDLAGRLGKKVELVQVGEQTELDKGMVEKITDPLTHLVRNSCDHGIEAPADRLARGKAEHGTITLSARHQGGSIVIEVRDDGKGLHREKLLAKAREKGLDAPDSLTDTEVWNLIFAPGFSTADEVTDVSGRGVGMDVVRRNITALGGIVEIESAEGFGMSVKVRLPLTLAIMDGMWVGVGDESYILPLASVVESFQATRDRIKTITGTSRVVRVRDEYLPVMDLDELFSAPRVDRSATDPLMVIVEVDGRRVAVIVDALLGQQQVVVKNLETNYRRVEYVSGATITGDGRVALILDAASLVGHTRH